MKRLPLTIENYRATIEGRKTQTRRVIKSEQIRHADIAQPWKDGRWEFSESVGGDDGLLVAVLKPHYLPDEVVALTVPHWRSKSGTVYNPAMDLCVHKRANGAVLSYLPGCPIPPPGREARWRRLPAHLMPLWACLHYVRILDVRPERLQDIRPADVAAEGLRLPCDTGEDDARAAFAERWDSINAKRGWPWSANPWVWVYDYCLTTPPYVDTRRPWL